MITTLAGRDQKNDRSDGNTGSKEIFRMIAMVAMLDQKKISFMKQACSAFLSCEFDPCVVHFACFFSGKTR